MLMITGTWIVVGVGIGLLLIGFMTMWASYSNHFIEHPTLALRYDVMSKENQRVWKLGFGLVGLGLLIVLFSQMLV